MRDIFEDERIIKAGKDLWLFMLLLLRNYVMKIQNCYSIHDVELAQRPILHVAISAITMIANASSEKHILPDSDDFASKEGQLTISETNKTMVLS